MRKFNYDAYIELTDLNFDEKLGENSEWVLLAFSALWCEACRGIEKELEPYAGRIPIYWVDIDESPHLKILYGIKALPTYTLLDENLKVLDKCEGKIGKTSYLFNVKKRELKK